VEHKGLWDPSICLRRVRRETGQQAHDRAAKARCRDNRDGARRRHDYQEEASRSLRQYVCRESRTKRLSQGTLERRGTGGEKTTLTHGETASIAIKGFIIGMSVDISQAIDECTDFDSNCTNAL